MAQASTAAAVNRALLSLSRVQLTLSSTHSHARSTEDALDRRRLQTNEASRSYRERPRKQDGHVYWPANCANDGGRWRHRRWKTPAHVMHTIESAASVCDVTLPHSRHERICCVSRAVDAAAVEEEEKTGVSDQWTTVADANDRTHLAAARRTRRGGARAAADRALASRGLRGTLGRWRVGTSAPRLQSCG